MTHTYNIRKVWAVYQHPDSEQLVGLLVTSRDWHRDSTGQLWVKHGRACHKAVRARPYLETASDRIASDSRLV